MTTQLFYIDAPPCFPRIPTALDSNRVGRRAVSDALYPGMAVPYTNPDLGMQSKNFLRKVL